jgi:hypothetical protein
MNSLCIAPVGKKKKIRSLCAYPQTTFMEFAPLKVKENYQQPTELKIIIFTSQIFLSFSLN